MDHASGRLCQMCLGYTREELDLSRVVARLNMKCPGGRKTNHGASIFSIALLLDLNCSQLFQILLESGVLLKCE